MIRSGDFLGRMKNGNPVYAVSEPTNLEYMESEPTNIGFGVLAIGVIGVAAMLGMFMADERKRGSPSRAINPGWAKVSRR